MSEVKVNKISPRSGTTVTLGDSGDTIAITSGASLTGFTSTGIDDNATSTAVTLDSSGRLLVGMSVASGSSNGIQLIQDGRIFSTVDGQLSAILNRKTSDGGIVEFRKDGTTVGSIGSATGGTIFIDGGSTYGGLQFGGNGSTEGRIAPRQNGVLADNKTNLGTNTYRFKDLYLGGNIYLGGTGSANALDDYETGAWTPVYGGGGSSPTITYGFQSGTYTKIGRMVIVQCNIRGQATAQGSDYLRIEGLPFPAKSTSGYSGVGSIGYSINWNADNAPALCVVSSGLSFITLRKYSTDDPRDEASVVVDAGNLATSSTVDNYVILTVAYETA